MKIDPTKVHWKPHEGKQSDCLAYEDVDEKLYGGGRGGGKTDAGLAWMVYPEYVQNPQYRGLVIRKNSVDLTDWIDRARTMYAPLNATFKGATTEIHFPSGAIIRTGHLSDDKAYTKYQGHEYQRILIEEASHIPSEDLYEKLIASCRSTIEGLKPRVMLTSNPDGDGRIWLKKRFSILPGDEITYFTTKQGKIRMYIPSTVKDNPSLLKDMDYVRNLESITDPALKAAWLKGDWESFGVKGAYYSDLLTIAKSQGRIKAFPHTESERVYLWFDLGIGDMMVIHFYQFIGREIHLIDMIEHNNEGFAWYAREILKKPYIYGGLWLPHDGKQKELGTGKSRQEVLQSLLPNIPVMIVPIAPIDDGINMARSKFNRLYINTDNCQRIVDALEVYRREWIEELQVFREKPVHDWSSHLVDPLRYMAMTDEPARNIRRSVSTTDDIYSPI